MAARLIDTAHGLGLVDDDAPELSPLVIDLSRPRVLTNACDLVRALGWQRGVRSIVDATGGLGRDAIALAHKGFTVDVCERAPLMQALWRDALSRYQPPRLTFHAACARTILHTTTSEAVFLDPMYPGGPRKALQQRELRLIRAAVEEDNDNNDDLDSLVDTALASAARVVVKRPRWAKPLRAPQHTWQGTSTCFDLLSRAHTG